MAFPITCPSCGKGFQLATEIYERKVAGKVVSIKCKQCGAGIRVDATTPGELKVAGVGAAAAGTDSGAAKQVSIHDTETSASPAKAAALPPRARQPTLLGMVGPGGVKVPKAPTPERAAPPPPAPPPPPAADAPLWAVDSGGTGDDRELTDDQMKREIEAGVLVATTLVWREGQPDWQELGGVPQLARYLPAAKPAPPPPRARQASAPILDLPAAPPVEEEEATMIYDRSAPNAAKFDLPDLPQEYEPAPAPPPLPAAGKPALPPVLPAAGRPPSAPRAAPPPLPGGPGNTAPFASPAPFAQPAAPAQGFPSPPPTAAQAPQAMPGARPASSPPQAAIPWGPGAPPPPSPMGVMAPNPFAVAASTTDLDFPKPKSKLPLVIGVLLVIGVAVGVVVATRSSGPAPGPVATPAAPPPVPAPTPAPTPTAEATTTATAAESATEAAPHAPGSSRDPMAPPEVPAAAPKPGGGFSDLFAAGMEKAEKSGTSQAPGHPFDQDEAKRAVAATLKTVAACKEPGSPLGQTSAAITFESSGKVSSVTIGAPFAGTSTGTCMVTAFKQVTVTPFAGLPGTVSQAVSLR